QLQRGRAARDRQGHRGGRGLRRLAVAEQPAPREPQRAALRDHVPGLRAGPDQDRRRGACGGAGPALGLRNAGLNFSGANAYAIDFLRPYQGYSDIVYYYFDGKTSYNSLQVAVQRRFSKRFTFGLAYTLSRATTTVSDDGTFTNNTNPAAFDYGLAAFDRTHYFVVNYVWNLPPGGKLLGGSKFAPGLLNNWTIPGISWMASGNPAELTLAIAGQDAGNRLLGTYTNGNGAGLQPRFHVNGDPQDAPNQINTGAFAVPAIGD